MQAVCIEHPTEAALERFLFNHAPEDECEELEIHLLACGRCMDRIEEIREFQVGLRDGFALYRQEEVQRAEVRTSSGITRLIELVRRMKWTSGGRIPRWTFSLAAGLPALAALLLGVFLLPNNGEPSGAPFDVSLAALRGDESGPVVPAGRQIEFHFNVEGLGPAPYAVLVVDSDGRPVGPVQFPIRADHPRTQLPAFQRGAYFLRLYAMKDGHADQDQLLREFLFSSEVVHSGP